MYLLYVDESGDPGRSGPDPYFVLSGLIVHESRWAQCFRMIKDLRVTLRDTFGIRRNAELHGNKNIAGRGAVWGTGMGVSQRIQLFQLVLETITQMPAVRSVNICIDKSADLFKNRDGSAIHEIAWKFLLQRFHNYVEQNGNSGGLECGLVLHDAGHDVEVRKLMRRLRVFNYVPSRYGSGSRNVPLLTLIEDPVPRGSYHAQFIQFCDYIAFSLLRREAPTTKSPGFEEVFDILQPILLREAARGDPDGVVRYPRT